MAFARSEGSGTSTAGFATMRRSATDAAKQRRRAKTALRAVAGDKPVASISATQARTAPFEILTEGVVPNLGRT